jgi:alpha-1,3-glucosyltransferase
LPSLRGGWEIWPAAFTGGDQLCCTSFIPNTTSRNHGGAVPDSVPDHSSSDRIKGAAVACIVSPTVHFPSPRLKCVSHASSRSTDFEVHRNWLALTHSLPLKDWYFEKTSKWTLDYPPFFAYFEWLLSQAAQLFDSQMLIVSNLNYASWQTIHFQRSTVILTELVLVFALWLFVRTSPLETKKQSHAAALSILLSPGLVIIDHIHFQYNAFLYGILILSVVLARKPSGLLWSGVIFTALLCLKHIYLYLAPAYFVCLLRAYCLGPRSIFDIRLANCVKLGLGIGVVAGLAFGPFIYYDQIPQVFSRLFPFSRGLCHAYWAPNIWALYSFADRVLIYGKVDLTGYWEDRC